MNFFKINNKILIILVFCVILIFLVSCTFLLKGYIKDKDNLINELRIEISDLNDDLILVKRENRREEGNEKEIDGIVKPQTPFCISGTIDDFNKKMSNIDYAPFRSLNRIDYLVKREDFKKFFDKSEYYQFCDFGGGGSTEMLFFVLYGDYGNYNNVVVGGINVYDEDNAKLVFDYKNNPDSGDIGMCDLDGIIESHLIYSCGGGDGPSSNNSVYLLNTNNGKSKTIKQCFYLYDKEEKKIDCKVDIFNLEK